MTDEQKWEIRQRIMWNAIHAREVLILAYEAHALTYEQYAAQRRTLAARDVANHAQLSIIFANA